MPTAVTISRPKDATSAVVFSSPHSGRVYPPDFLARAHVPQAVLRSSEDAFVDQLIADAPAFGATLITTEVPRAFVDFNRAADELDPALVEGVSRAGLNPRIASGLGVLARVVAGGRSIYRGKLPRAEADQRIQTYWHPFHDALCSVMTQTHMRFGQVLLCDVHSMPHEALSGHVLRGGRRPDMVLGDRWGASASDGLVDAVGGILTAAGFTVARNTPFAGAYIVQRYGQPSQGMHALQLEIDRALYLDEATVTPLPGFDAFRSRMRDVVARIAALDPGQVALDLAAQ